MINRLTPYMISGVILCIGSLAWSVKLPISGSAFAAGARLQPVIAESTLAGAPQILGPRKRTPQATGRPALPETDLEVAPAVNEHAIERCDIALTTPSIMSIQRALSRRGYDPGPIDGVMGPRTRKAISAYEDAKGRASPGTVNPGLCHSLTADLTRKSRLPYMSGQDANERGLPAGDRPPETTIHEISTRESTKHSTTMLMVPNTATNTAPCQTAKAEPPTALELAVTDLFNALRATAKIAVHLFTGPGSPYLATAAGSDPAAIGPVPVVPGTKPGGPLPGQGGPAKHP